MKKIGLLLGAFFILSVASAQEKGVTVGYEARGSVIGKKEFNVYELSVNVGYNFNSVFSARAVSDFSLGHYKKHGIKTYAESGTLGAGIGVNVLRRQHSILQVVASAGNTVQASDWRFFYTDVGLKWGIGMAKTKMMLGYGVRYYNSQRSNFKDYTKGYISVGMMFN